MTHFLIRVAVGAMVAALTPSVAAAQEAAAQEAAASPLDTVYVCAAITVDAERLACFDREIATLRGREAAREIVAIDAETAKAIKRDSFGLSMPSLPKLKLPKLGGGDGPEEVRLAVEDVRKRGRDWVVTMENGQIWQQTSGRLNYVPSGDLTAIISEGAVGSYRLYLSNGKTTVKGLKARRVR